MKHTYALALLFLPSLSHAQVTIGQADMPAAGDVKHLTTALPDPTLDITSTGAGQTWDFSTLYAIGQNTTTYQTVASTNPVYALVYADLPFNPNRSNHAAPGVSIPFSNLLPIDDPYTFYHRSNTAYRVMGFGAGISGLPVPITFDQPDVIHQLPVAFGNAHVSNSSYSINIPTLAYYGYAQTRNSSVDGWGTLITPAGTFNTLRVKAVISGRDTIQVDQLGLGFAIDRPTITEYTWLSPGISGAVLAITTTTVLGAEVITSVRFHDDLRSLTIAQPLPSPVCAGATMQVVYAATGAFNPSGLLLPANQFRVQLSDAQGSFSNPVTIGTVTANTSGNITATIPANTPAGSGYRIRVVATSPAFIGTDNGADLTIDPQPEAFATVQGPPTLCAGGSVDISVPLAPATFYQWYLDGVQLPGADQHVVTATVPGAYAVSVTNVCGSQVSPPVFIGASPAPVHLLSDTLFTVCPGAPFTLLAIDQSGLSPLTYQWQLDGVDVPGAVDPTFVVDTTGSVTVVVTHSTSGCTFSPVAATAVAAFVAEPVVTAAGTTMLCPGGEVTLVIQGSTASTWAWSLDGLPVPNANDTLLVATAAGDYTAIALDDQGCVSDPSNTITVGVLPGPAAPVIVLNGAATFCDGDSTMLSTTPDPGLTIQWTLNGQAIAGADAADLMVTSSGTYAVTVQDADGCTTTSAIPVEVIVFPQPASPVITADADSLYTNAGPGTYLWFYNGDPIPGATDPWSMAIATGDYTVLFTDTNGCSTLAQPYTYLSTGITARSAVAPTLWPNPTHGPLVVELPTLVGMTEWRLLDQTGRLMDAGTVMTTRWELSLEALAPGPYVLWLHSGDRMDQLRLVKQ